MYLKLYLCFLLQFIPNIICEYDKRDEEICMNYFKTGEDLNLTILIGEWFPVYYWPPLQWKKNKCDIITFREISKSQIHGCEEKIPYNEMIVEASYKNTVGKLTNLYYYGAEEVKYQVRSCDEGGRTSKYIFTDLEDGYVMGVSCSNGRGVLLSRTLPSASEVQSVVDDIEPMKGRQGSTDCPLP